MEFWFEYLDKKGFLPAPFDSGDRHHYFKRGRFIFGIQWLTTYGWSSSTNKRTVEKSLAFMLEYIGPKKIDYRVANSPDTFYVGLYSDLMTLIDACVDPKFLPLCMSIPWTRDLISHALATLPFCKRDQN